MTGQSPESLQPPYLAKPIYDSYGYLLTIPGGEVEALRGYRGHEAAVSEAAALGMWVGHAILDDYPTATEEDSHESLGYALPYLRIEPEVANVVYETAMETFTSSSPQVKA